MCRQTYKDKTGWTEREHKKEFTKEAQGSPKFNLTWNNKTIKKLYNASGNKQDMHYT